MSWLIYMPIMTHRKAIGVKLPTDLIEEVDAFRSRQDFPIERTAIIERALREWLERNMKRKGRAA